MPEIAPLSPPASPCIRVCTLDDESYCVGCGRHLNEIAAWSRMSVVEQWAVCERSAQRRVSKAAQRAGVQTKFRGD